MGNLCKSLDGLRHFWAVETGTARGLRPMRRELLLVSRDAAFIVNWLGSRLIAWMLLMDLNEFPVVFCSVKGHKTRENPFNSALVPLNCSKQVKEHALKTMKHSSFVPFVLIKWRHQVCFGLASISFL